MIVAEGMQVTEGGAAGVVPAGAGAVGAAGAAAVTARPPGPPGPARPVAVEGARFALHRLDPPRRGRRPPVLLLHGVPETALCWRRLAPELARDRVVLAPDLKGLGGSEARHPYDLVTLAREQAALVLHELEGLPGDGRVDVVGHDWGGSIALALAGTRPDLVRRLVVVSAPYRHVDLLHAWHVPLFALPWLPEALLAVAGRGLVPRMFRYAWRAPRPLEPEALARYVEAYAPPARRHAMLAYYRAATRPRVAAVLSRLARGRRAPAGGAPAGAPPGVAAERTLVVWGAADPSLPLSVGQAVVRDLGRQVDPASVRMVELPGVGHWPVEEAADEVVPLVAEFLRAP